jgi:hypothetical protein
MHWAMAKFSNIILGMTHLNKLIYCLQTQTHVSKLSKSNVPQPNLGLTINVWVLQKNGLGVKSPSKEPLEWTLLTITFLYV